ncbi:MAG: SdrD B-like domain-containing protein [Thermomicrobiales bacterium]
MIGDETPIVMTPGLDVTGRDFVEIEFGAISGSVLADVDDNGTGEAPLAGVTLTLLDGAGDPVATTTTDALGGYRFDDLFPGIYQVLESQPSGYGSVSDVDGGNPNHIGNVAAITVNPGQEVGGRDFIEIELGTISGYVFAGATPLAGSPCAARRVWKSGRRRSRHAGSPADHHRHQRQRVLSVQRRHPRCLSGRRDPAIRLRQLR